MNNPLKKKNKEKMMMFSLLPKDVLRMIMQMMDCAATRNFLLTCKTIYYSATPAYRKARLWCLGELLEQSHDTISLRSYWGKGKICNGCGAWYKHKKHLHRCKGKKQCYICWKWFATPQVGPHLQDAQEKHHIHYRLNNADMSTARKKQLMLCWKRERQRWSYPINGFPSLK
jgi:hypothetical protein